MNSVSLQIRTTQIPISAQKRTIGMNLFILTIIFKHKIFISSFHTLICQKKKYIFFFLIAFYIWIIFVASWWRIKCKQFCLFQWKCLTKTYVFYLFNSIYCHIKIYLNVYNRNLEFQRTCKRGFFLSLDISVFEKWKTIETKNTLTLKLFYLLFLEKHYTFRKQRKSKSNQSVSRLL